MFARGPIFSLVPIDLSQAGTKDFNEACSVVIFVRAEDAAGALALDAKVGVQLGDIASAAVPAGVNAFFKLARPTSLVRFTWDAQPGVTAYFIVAADDALMVHAPPARQLVTQAMGAALSVNAYSVGVGAIQVAAASATRQKVTVRNNSAAATVYVGPDSVTSATGFPLGPGEAYTFEGTTADVYALSSAVSTDVRVVVEG